MLLSTLGQLIPQWNETNMAQKDCIEPGDKLENGSCAGEQQSQNDPDRSQSTWWNRSIGPVLLTILLAPFAWTVMLVVYAFMGIFVVVGMGGKRLQSVCQYLNLFAGEQ
ncbi:MAG: hypothetical protein AAGM36_05610 [Cyanobacteria bacterium J06597_1]